HDDPIAEGRGDESLLEGDDVLGPAFFARDTTQVARELIGCLLVSTKGGTPTGGRIVETEAYLGHDDVGSHAATRGITKRNAVMFGAPGRAYVYFTYGNHHMLNLVTEPEGTAGAVLIRAIEPLIGLEMMTVRRHGRPERELANGPGKLAAALGLDLKDNGSTLGAGQISVHVRVFDDVPITTTGRVGLSVGWEAPLRFHLTDSPWVSKGRTGPLLRGPRHQEEGKCR
ncbi:MAG: DNA-3-methyladenine glycosylase, partial [Actinomycetota bacterium]|nr:DNA-3-methyladenine glycosylase [Actinomycetota bacterium]